LDRLNNVFKNRPAVLNVQVELLGEGVSLSGE